MLTRTVYVTSPVTHSTQCVAEDFAKLRVSVSDLSESRTLVHTTEFSCSKSPESPYGQVRIKMEHTSQCLIRGTKVSLGDTWSIDIDALAKSPHTYNTQPSYNTVSLIAPAACIYWLCNPVMGMRNLIWDNQVIFLVAEVCALLTRFYCIANVIMRSIIFRLPQTDLLFGTNRDHAMGLCPWM